MSLPSFMSADPAEAEDLSAAQAPGQEQQEQQAAPQADLVDEAAPAADAAPAAPADAAAPSGQPPAGTPPGFVPLRTFLDMRDELAEAKRRIPQVQQPQPDPAPDRFEDPEGYEAWQQRQFEGQIHQERQARLNDKLNVSERIARTEHGAELVDKAKAWGFELGKTNPAFARAALNQAFPYDFMVAEYQKAERLKAISDPTEFQAYQAWKSTQTPGGQPAPADAAPPNPAAPAVTPTNPTPPRPSIAGAPSAAGPSAAVVQGGEATYQRMFGR